MARLCEAEKSSQSLQTEKLGKETGFPSFLHCCARHQVADDIRSEALSRKEI